MRADTPPPAGSPNRASGDDHRVVHAQFPPDPEHHRPPPPPLPDRPLWALALDYAPLTLLLVIVLGMVAVSLA